MPKYIVAITLKVQVWANLILLALLSVDLTVLPTILPEKYATKVAAWIGIGIAAVKVVLNIVAKFTNTDGTPQAVAFEPQKKG